MKHWLAFTALLAGACLTAAAQPPKADYQPTINDSLCYAPAQAGIAERVRQRLANLPKEDRAYYKELFQERGDYIAQQFTQKKLYCQPAAQAYLRRILQEIVQANPVLGQDSIHLFFTNTEVPNAASLGERVLVFNTGLFRQLANESQAAFVLCHELAHLQRNHNDAQVETLVKTLYGEETQAQLKEIKRSQYGRSQQLEALAKRLKLNRSRHSRYKESEADSLALAFLRPTRFDAREAVGALQMLDTADADAFPTNAVVQAQFGTAEHPFQAQWIAKEEGLLGGHAAPDAAKLDDSLKTHPDCALRLASLRTQLAGYQPGAGVGANPVDAALFARLQTTLWLDNLEYYFQQKRMDLALYHSLRFLHQNAQPNVHAVTMIGRSLNALYDAQKARRRNEVAAMPAPGNSPAFNDFLQFLQNLDAADLATINLAFLEKHQAAFAPQPAFAKTLAEARRKR